MLIVSCTGGDFVESVVESFEKMRNFKVKIRSPRINYEFNSLLFDWFAVSVSHLLKNE